MSKSVTSVCEKHRYVVKQLTLKIDQLMEETDTKDKEYVPSTWQAAKLKSRPDSVLLELPTKGLAEATAVISARLKISTNASLSLFAKVIQLGHGDVHDFIISRSTV